jgi:TolB-like protein
MSSIIPGYEYDIFISYRQKDNKYDGWVTEFVENLKKELEATFKEEISIYFDINPHDGILDAHIVEKSLENKLKCLIFIPVISQTYCDPRSFAWQNEFCAFNKQSKDEKIGRDIKLSSGNVISRILPIKIHDLEDADRSLLEDELGGTLRAIEFIFRSPGVNRPLRSNEDHPHANLNKTFYRDQMNKVANTIKEIITGIRRGNTIPDIETIADQKIPGNALKKILPVFAIIAFIGLAVYFYSHFSNPREESDSEFEKTIAVLPFIDLSPEGDKEYFSDGMLEEILNNLYKVGDLKVTSRTSSMQYKGETKKSIREIASELGVANILEGSVRLYENTIRITVQLIRADTDEHLWANNYDRDFSDIFSIQSEVALKVANELKAEISPETRRLMDIKPTSNPIAYDLILKAKDLDYYDKKETEKAIELCRQAIELDPEFSYAYQEIGYRLTVGSAFLATTEQIEPAKAWQDAQPYFEKSIKLNPDYAEGHIWLAWGLLWYEWDFDGSRKAYEEVKRVYPNYSWTDYEVASGNFEKAYREAVAGIDIDSRNFLSWTSMIISSWFANSDPEGVIMKAQKTSIKDNEYVRAEIARVYMYMKEYDKAILTVKDLERDFPGINSPRLKAILAISKYNTGHAEEATHILDELKQQSNSTTAGSPAFYSSMIYSVMENADQAFAWLEKAYAHREVEMYWLKVEPPFEPIRNDPRFKEMLDKVGFSK